MSKPIVLRTGSIISGRYYEPGAVLPYEKESEVPPNLKPLITSDPLEIPDPAVRDLYTLPPHLRRQGRELEREAWEREQAERQAATPLPEDVREVLAEQHAARIAKLKAQAEYNQSLTDAAYDVAGAEVETKETQYYVRRGGEMARVQNARLKPGETTFVKRPNGEYEASGYVDATGAPPDPEIHL